MLIQPMAGEERCERAEDVRTRPRIVVSDPCCHVRALPTRSTCRSVSQE